jgi:uncharacterized membrane protein YgcG
MVKTFIALLFFVGCLSHTKAQEYFTIKRYEVAVVVSADASLDISEKIRVHFTEQRHGIFRFIPYKYQLQTLAPGAEKAHRPLETGSEAHTLIEDIKVDGWKYKVSNEGNYKVIKIGSADKYVDGDQQYVIRYRMLNAINFFNDFSELYFNVIGDKWPTTVDSVHFSVTLYKALPDTPAYFVATGPFGSKKNHTVSRWHGTRVFSGYSTKALGAYEGITLGMRFPKDFLVQPDYRFRGIYWLLLPLVIFGLLLYIWRRWGKDEGVTIQTEYYPPPNISPSISGYIIDDRLNQRDLTALVPYWGAGGYLQVNEIENSSLFGLVKSKDYEFIKLKELPPEAMGFEKTLFSGIFQSGDRVLLKDLKNVLYKTMAVAKKGLEREVRKNEYYVKGTREVGAAFVILAILLGAYGFAVVVNEFYESLWHGIALLASAVLFLFFGLLMGKRTRKGTLLYEKLAGFKEFICLVEKDRLQEFLKQDEHYFDKILPYAVVFNVADSWKDKLDGLDIPPPIWYTGHYNTFNTGSFLKSLDQSMNKMSAAFYSKPSSSGGSFGSGGSSGGGFGGGGGGSW